MNTWQHFKAFASLPFMAIFGVPLIILLITSQFNFGWFLAFPLNFIPTIVGCVLIVLGVYLLVITTYFFAKFGQGTVAHWAPPTKLVIHGIYRHVRNPMVLGVVLTVLGETILFGSISLFILFIVLFVGNHLLFVKLEEPDLVKRFGKDYELYMKNVPRWLPRLKPWTGLTPGSSKFKTNSIVVLETF